MSYRTADSKGIGVRNTGMTLLNADITHRIIGCAFAVHNELGPGLKEGFYQRALAVKFEQAGLSHAEERAVEVFVDGVTVGLLYLDHLVEESVVVEIKALPHKLTNDELGQVITYLGATGKEVGLLFNFGGRSLEFRRVFPSKQRDAWKHRIRRYAWRPPKP